MTEPLITKYQQRMVHQTISSCDHGLLLWWKMGTGKTIAALTLLLNYPGVNTIIVCPKNLHNSWLIEMAKVPKINNKITFMFYGNLDKLFKNINFNKTILIFDECHHLAKYIHASKEVSKNIHLLNSSYKIYLLTGTPIDKDFADIVPLINIAAGKEVIPYNNHTFKKRYFKDDVLLGITRGYLFEVGRMIFIGAVGLPITGLGMLGGIQTASGATTLGINYYFFPLFILGTVLTYLKYAYYNDVSDYKYLDKHKLSNDIVNYINYYDSVYDKTYLLNYPTKTIHKKNVSYSEYQVRIWYSLTEETVSKKTIMELDITTKEDVDYFSKTLDYETYFTKGVLIGNLHNVFGKYCKKFYEILEIARGKRAVFYSSSMHSGSSLFMSFLDDNDIKYLFLDNNISLSKLKFIINKFKNTTTFLILHPVYTEGITIYGAEQFHLLEPIWSLAKKQQVLARVARYGSHSHLPQSKRHVDIYEWICTTPNFAKLWAEQMLSWVKSSKVALWSVDYRRFNEFSTPDQEISAKEKKLGTDDFATVVMNKQAKHNIDCCIKFPNMSQEKACIKKINKRCTGKSKCKIKIK
jgi:SNF2 family DNA or RNA helicase